MGAQFVHRFLYWCPFSPVEAAIAANAGWYTMPNMDEAWPYGLQKTPLADSIDMNLLRYSFACPLIILLGSQDTNPESKDLRHTPEAEKQGPHRLARGQAFVGE